MIWHGICYLRAMKGLTMNSLDSSKPAHQAGLLLLLIVSLIACAPASECEPGENADGTCAFGAE